MLIRPLPAALPLIPTWAPTPSIRRWVSAARPERWRTRSRRCFGTADGVFDDPTREAIKLELGDVLWYVAQLASELGYDLEEVATANLDKLASRAARGRIGGSGDHR